MMKYCARCNEKRYRLPDGRCEVCALYQDERVEATAMKFILKQKEKNWGLWFGIYLLTTGSHLELLHAKAILEAAFARVKAEPVADATGCSLSDKEYEGSQLHRDFQDEALSESDKEKLRQAWANGPY